MQIFVVNKTRCIEYRRTMEFPRCIVPSNAQWFFIGLTKLAKKSRLSPYYLGDIQGFIRGVRAVQTAEAWQLLCRTEVASMTANLIVSALTALETCIKLEKLTGNSPRNTSVVSRRFILEFISEDGGEEVAKLAKNIFRTELGKLNPPRPLISDSVLHQDGVKVPPLGALVHENLQDLNDKIGKRLQADVDIVKNACLAQLSLLDSQVEWLRRAENYPVTQKEISSFKASGRFQPLTDLGPAKLLAIYLAHARAGENPGFAPSGLKYMPSANAVLKYANAHLPAPISTSRELFYLEFALRGATLLACLILLQIHTHWNSSTVISLNESCVRTVDGNFVIQGFKSRTDDHSPSSLITPKDAGPYRAIQLLIGRLAHMKRLGWATADATSLWVARKYESEKTDRIFAGFQRPLEQLCDSSGLKRFSLDQLRSQMIALTFHRNGHETARLYAGHKSLQTLTHYLDQPLIKQISSAINLQFQKKVELTVSYHPEFSEEGVDMRSGVGRRATPACTPIGDGASCINPMVPPELEWLANGTCSAQNCHQGSGCPNRLIAINPQRMREVALTTKYYVSNWKRLAAENVDKFREYHLPAVIFNGILRAVLLDGAYAPIMRQIEKEILS
jgi:hypothetical protein